VANQLTMALIDTIQRLRQQKWSQRRIAVELGIDRETVSRYLRLSEAPKPATAGGALSDSKPASADGALSDPAPPGTRADLNDCSACTTRGIEALSARAAPGPASQCAPFHEHILAKLDQGLSGQRIWQDLVSDHGFMHEYHSVRRYIAKLGAGTPVPFRRMECAPGEEVQVDFGQGAFLVLPEGKRRRPHVFRVVLSHSRKGYSEVVLRQTTDAFLQCLENAFWHFGGVPRRVVLDNLKAAVLHTDWFDPELHPKIQAFAAHYGCVFLPTKPRMPRHKGKVERGVDYVQENALKGRTFASLQDQNEYLWRWEAETADPRVHGTTRQAVGPRFVTLEKPALLPLPIERFANFHEAQRRVHRDGHVEVAKAYYSVAPEYVGQNVWVRWDGRLVRVFNERFVQITVHAQQLPGKFSTHAQHIVTEKINAVERGAEYLLTKVRRFGATCVRWAEAMLERRGVEGMRVLQGLLHLAKKHGREAISRACAAAHAHSEYRLRTVRALLKRQEVTQPVFEFMDEHPLIRPLQDYGQFVRDALHKGGSTS
jgi:transposase